MKVSIIIPIYLGKYATAANNREEKLFRAINSATEQTYKDIEVVCMIDTCPVALRLFQTQIDKININKVKIFELKYNKFVNNRFVFNPCLPRQAGIDIATGDVICYLDSDDYLTEDHVQKIVNNFSGNWVYFDAWLWNLKTKQWRRDNVTISHQYKCGTCNIAHRKESKAIWRNPRYGHDDWQFIVELKKESDGKYIGEAGYRICHWHNPKYDI